MPRGIVPIRPEWPDRPADPLDMRARCIVATAVLERSEFGADGGDFSGPPDWADPESPWWWHLADVRTLAEPIRVQRGQLGLWRLPDDVAARLEAA